MAKFIEDEKIKGYYRFKCPACGGSHFCNTNPEYHPVVWNFNGNLNKPTVSPSIKLTWSYGEPEIQKCCHFFIVDGYIQYQGDCTHSLAGKTVELENF